MQNRASGGFAVSHLPHIVNPVIVYLKPENVGTVTLVPL
jgi:hypothetical protein